MLKIRRPNGRLIFNMEIAIRRLDGLYIETGPRCLVQSMSWNLGKYHGCWSLATCIAKPSAAMLLIMLKFKFFIAIYTRWKHQEGFWGMISTNYLMGDMIKYVIISWWIALYSCFLKMIQYINSIIKVRPWKQVLFLYICGEKPPPKEIHLIGIFIGQGGVSLMFRELSKVFSRNLCIAEIVLVMRISSWNFVCVPKAMLWAHEQSFNLKFSP